MKVKHHMVLSFTLCLTAGAVFASGKTAEEWFREYESVVLTLTDEGQRADEARQSSDQAMSNAAKAGEAAAVAEYEKGITGACAVANEMATWIKEEGYLDDREGFEKLLRVVDIAIKYVKAPHKPKSTLAADRVMKNLNKASFVLSSALEWLRDNKCVRDEARAARKDIEQRFCTYFKKNPVPDCAKDEFQEGMKLLDDGKGLFAKSDFAEALKCFSESRTKLASARSRAVVLVDVPVPVEL